MLIFKYISREILITFLLTTVVLLSIVVLIIPFFQFSRISGVLDEEFFLKVMPYFIPLSLGYIIPIAVLAGSVFVFGRLSHDNELIAMKSNGINLIRIIIAPVIIGVVLSLIVGYINTRMAPYCISQTRNLSISTFKNRIFSPMTTVREIKLPNYRINYNDYQNGIFYGIRMIKYDINGNNLLQDLMAREGRFSLDEENAVFSLNLSRVIDTHWKKESVGSAASPEVIQSDTMEYQVDISGLFLPRKKNLAAMSERELNKMIISKNTERFREREILTEKYRRFALGITPLIFILIGVPAGMLSRQSNRLAGIGIAALIIFVGYYPLMILGNLLGAKGGMPPYMAVWVANAVLAVVGLVLLPKK
ncbi:MAG: LptF/LptG family permease [Candidatus Brocadiia bacterium]